MIDLHSHILPGIDDGARSIDNSVEMAVQAIEAGVTKMVCTPHIHQGYFNNDLSSIKSAFDELKHQLVDSNSALKIAYAAEVRICPEVTQWIQNGTIPFIGKWKDRHAFLLELPHSHVPPGSDNLIRWLVAKGVQPIVVHPERNRDIINDYRKLGPLKQAGAIFQVTAGAFVGRFSEAVKDVALRMLEEQKIAFIASDTHNIERRPNDMGACRDTLLSLISEESVHQLMYATPDLITKDLAWT